MSRGMELLFSGGLHFPAQRGWKKEEGGRGKQAGTCLCLFLWAKRQKQTRKTNDDRQADMR